MDIEVKNNPIKAYIEKAEGSKISVCAIQLLACGSCSNKKSPNFMMSKGNT